MQTSIEQPAETPAEHLSKSSVDSIDDGAKSMSASKLKRSDWFIVFAITLLIALRSWSIANEHSATWDTIYHLDRAVSFAHGTLDTQTQLNDPPMGEVIAFVPYLIAKTFVSEPPLDAMLQWIAIWKSLLLFPALLAAFCWARDLYNREAGWLVVALIALEPTLAAMTAYATLDSLAISAILPAAYLGFRYAQRPTWRGLFLLAISTAFALVCKHTAIALLPIGGLQAINAFISRRRRTERYPIGAHIVVGSVVGLLALWTFTGFDFSPGSRIHPGLEDAPGFRFPADSLPAGVYFRSFSDASLHAAIGHNGFLWGEIRGQGWWYYYFVNALYKVPLGMFLLAVIALGRPRFARVEIGLIIPIAGYVAFCIASTVAIGFRHALPLEILCFIGIGRIMQRAVIVRRAAWVITAITLINIALWHPNYLSFINAPRERVWMQISDSNLDWGQGLKQVRNWIESKRASRDNRSVSLIYFGSPDVLNGYRGLPDELNDDVHIGLPDSMSGWLITTPIAVSRQYADPVLPVGFQSLKPTEMIGDSLLVFDLDDPKVRAAIEESPERE